MRREGIVPLVLGLVLAGCSHPAKQQAEVPEVPYDTSLPIKEFMGHVMQHAADEVWKWQGYKSDALGEHSLFPKNEADWEQAESGSLTLAEIRFCENCPGAAHTWSFPEPFRAGWRAQGNRHPPFFNSSAGWH